MFTGIIEEVGRVISSQPGKLIISAAVVLRDTELGASIDVNGVCLTVTSFTANSFSTDVMPETARRSNLALLKAGDKVNLERPMTLGGRLGGHLVEGHVDATGRLTYIRREEGGTVLRFEAPREVMHYIVEKGFIAVDGISLTVVSKETDSFQVSIVDYTMKHTNLDEKHQGDVVNLEVDIIAKYVEEICQNKQKGITMDFLNEHGF